MLNNLFGRKSESVVYTVMLVSDDPGAARLVSDILFANDYVVRAAGTNDEAMRLLESGDLPDILIGDFTMPESDGKDLLTRMQNRFGKSVLPPIIFLLDAQDDETAARALGVADLLPKPVAADALIACMTALLAKNTTV